ncbi:MAG TPA: GNAT family N-acetyltransferase [Micromonosporaceae bacterium]|nr:GNAT family N-acetyltransferase [Micromonosporaceae bacterium]
MAAEVRLREVTEADLAEFFLNQLDPDANRMAAFTAPDPADHEAFSAHWARLLADDAVTVRTVLVDGRVAGNVLLFPHAGQPEVGYWLGRRFWGRGVATRALSQFLELIPTRPLYARAAKDNAASVRVLAKCGFAVVGEGRGYANARRTEVEEYVLRLDR